MNRKVIGLILAFTLLASTTSFADKTFSPFHSDIYALGMGDAFVAYGNNANGFLYNPALLVRANGLKFSVIDIQASINTSFLDVVNYMSDNQEKFEDWDNLSAGDRNELLAGMESFDDRWVTGGGYPSVNLVLPLGVGLAVYNNLSLKVKLDKGIYEPRGYADLKNDLVFVGGYARQITDNLALGANAKFISRRNTGAIKLRASEFGNANDIYETAKDSLESAKSGFGLDMGALYSLKSNLDLGVSINDLIGGIDDDHFPINLRAGVSYRYTGGFVGNGFLKEIVFAGDIEDLFNQDGDNFFNKVHLGADIVMPIINFRFGFNQGYPCIGTGLNLKFVALNYAYIGKELGSSPGRQSDYSHYVQLKIGIM